MTRTPGIPLSQAGGLPPLKTAQAVPEAGVSLSSDLSRILRPQAAYRWLLPGLAAITPQYVEMTLRGALAGNHVQAWELFDLMIDTDPEIAACITELVEGVLKKKLIIEPYHEEDEEPSEDAIQRQKVVSAALKKMRPDPAADENDLKGTIRDLLFSKYHGQSVLEIDWSAGIDREELNIIQTELGDITAPRATYWVHPVCYAWDMTGRLGLRTELGTVRNTTKSAVATARGGSPTNTWNSIAFQPRPTGVEVFPEHKFLIGIGKAKAGTALGGSQLRVLAWWWVASNFCGDWLLNLAQLFGIPFRKAKYQSGTPEAIKEEIRQMLQNCGSAGYILTPEGAEVEFMEAGGGASQSPQAFLFEFADRQKRKVLLGQTMTGSGLSSSGKGGLAGMEVEQDSVKQARIDAAGNAACDVINQQLIRSILILNYGDDDCAPTVRLLEEMEGGLNDAQRDQVLISAGLKVGANFMRKKYGIPEPGADEEILGAAAAPKLDDDEPLEKAKPEVAAKSAEIGNRKSEISNDLATTLHEILLPIINRLDAIAKIDDAAIQQHLIEKLLKDFPAIAQALAADHSLAQKLSPLLEQSLLKGLKS